MVAIDPGIVTAGYAVFRARDFNGDECPRPIFAAEHTLEIRKKASSPETNALKMVSIVERGLRSYRVEQIHCERMEFRSNAQGIAAIDDVLGVQFACGAYARLAVELGAAYHPAPVSQWKGQLSKEQVVSRILKRWSAGKALEAKETLKLLSSPDHPSHDWDAVGIGLWAAGHFG